VAYRAGQNVVLGGFEPLRLSILAGGGFLFLWYRHGAAEIGEIRRQREDWQRQATRELATGRTAEALRAYEQHGAIRVAETHEAARVELIDRWAADRAGDPARSRLILAHTRDDVRILNDLARDALKSDGTIVQEIAVQTERGERLFGTGDRLMFLRNERDLGVKNGTLATVERVSPRHIEARLDNGRHVGFDLKNYAHIDHGYAATIHKSQGVTVDGTYVLATPGMDQHSSYVALSRHSEAVQLHYGKDDFAGMRELDRTLGRERAKDTTLDYGAVRDNFAETRGYDRSAILDALDKNRFVEREHIRHEPKPDMFASLREHLARQNGSERDKARSPFEGLKLDAGPMPRSPRDDMLSVAVQRYAAAHEELAGMKAQGLPTLTFQRGNLSRAAAALDKIAPHAARDLAEAFVRRPELVAQAAQGRTQTTIRAMHLEAEVRTNPDLRADRFAESWKQLKAEHERLKGWQNDEARGAVTAQMKALAGSLEKDPAMAKALGRHAKELGVGRRYSLEWRFDGPRNGGIDIARSRSVSQALMDSLGRSRDRDRGLGL
jgi:hypothetical protein